MTTAARRAQTTGEIVRRTAIDEPMIERLVHAFYARIRTDALLGPIFDTRIADWQPHLRRMCAFWSSVALMSGRRHGQPMEKHLPLPVDARHFDRWMDLFAQTAREVCPASAADHFIERARRIAESLELGVACRNGVLLAEGQRFSNRSASAASAPGIGG